MRGQSSANDRRKNTSQGCQLGVSVQIVPLRLPQGEVVSLPVLLDTALEGAVGHINVARRLTTAGAAVIRPGYFDPPPSLSFCCAAAGPATSASTATNTRAMKQILLTHLMVYFFLWFFLSSELSFF
jgi:hypothetical protein